MSDCSITLIPGEITSTTRANPPEGVHCADELVLLFDGCFAQSCQTRLYGGAAEPEYIPAHLGATGYHEVHFREDFFASALHEIAHWCIAGIHRRQQRDYGYWYEPDGRSRDQQQMFERVEARPQALEWILSRACGFPFRISLDNLSGDAGAGEGFTRAVITHARKMAHGGLPARAAALRAVLCAHYGQSTILTPDQFADPPSRC